MSTETQAPLPVDRMRPDLACSGIRDVVDPFTAEQLPDDVDSKVPLTSSCEPHLIDQGSVRVYSVHDPQTTGVALNNWQI